MKKLTTILAAAALATLSGAVGAAPVNFESDTTGTKANGFVSSDSAIVSFTDTLGSQLSLANFGAQGDGISLAVRGDDASKLQMDFSQSVTGLSLDFGNDDPGFIGVGGLAILQGFFGGSMVGQILMAVNRNDLMDQTINLGSLTIDRALFFYAEANESPAGLIEIVDNINFDVAVVPVPASLPLLLGALGGIVMLRRRKKS